MQGKGVELPFNRAIPLKTINYQGGMVRFSVPAIWREEYEPAGAAVFYEEAAYSGTLRLNVYGFELAPGDTTPFFPYEQIILPERAAVVETLPDGKAMARYIKNAIADGEHLQTAYWEVSIPLTPWTLRIVVFSYTTLASMVRGSTVRQELDLLDASISCAEFSI